MADNNHIKNVALVGASGTIGTEILAALLATNTFHQITIISRADSTATFPEHASIKVQKVSYSEPEALQSAFQGVEAAVFALGFMAMGEQAKLIDAAAKAGAKWILPTEYAGDGMNEALVDAVPLFHPKRNARKQVAELAKMHEGLSWVGVATNPWMEFSMQRGLFGFDAANKTATLYSDSGKFNSTTLPQAGRAIAKLLSLPITNTSNPRASLSHYANNFAYVSSFLVSQDSLFAALQKATDTQESDWTVKHSTIKEWMGVCLEGMKQGDMRAGAGMTYAHYMGEGKGGNYEGKAKEDREVLGLQKEDLDEAVARAVQAGEAPPVVFKK